MAFEAESRTRFQLFLAGLARLDGDRFEVFARLRGGIFNDPTKIGLRFILGLDVVQGDANMDGRVDINDAALVGLAYDTREGVSGWNPDADVNLDDRVDILDAAEVGIYYDSIY